MPRGHMYKTNVNIYLLYWELCNRIFPMNDYKYVKYKNIRPIYIQKGV